VEWLVQVPTQGPEQVLVVRDYFPLLGKVIGDHWLNQELKALMATRESKILSLQGNVAARESEIHALQGEIAARQNEIATRDARITNIYQSLSGKLTSALRTGDRWLKIHH
jgi:hypothetical protein